MTMNPDELDDDDIPDSAFTGEAPKREAPERKPSGNGQTGPACPEKCKDRDGKPQRMWVNTTKNGKTYFRCSRCAGCWWPMRDNKKAVDPDSKWPPLNK